MKALHFSTNDLGGGAAKAAYRLHQALRQHGQLSALVVAKKSGRDPDVHAAKFNPLLARFYRWQHRLPFFGRNRARFTFNFDVRSGIRLQSTLSALPFRPEVVFLHWTSGLLTTADIRRVHDHFRCPMFLIVLDQEPVTGGCHYSFGCQRYTQQCGRCPLLSRPGDRDASRLVWERKQRHLADLPITLVAPTSWTEARVRASSLYKSHPLARIALPIDTSLFRPGNPSAARTKLGLPMDRRIVFFGSSYLHEPRKGMQHLRDALGIFAERDRQNSRADRMSASPVLLIAGRNPEQLVRDLPLESRWLGHLDERELATAYQAADVFVCPSTEDAGPMMIPEAMLCGTPVVAYNAGGAPDLIDHGRTGFLAELNNAAALGAGISSLLTHITKPNTAAMRQHAATKAFSVHDPKHVAGQFVALFQQVCAQRAPRAAA